MLQTAIISENLIKPLKKFSFSDQHFLWIMRMNIILVALIAVLFAYWKANIYELVAEASITLLVSLFVPLTAGLYWHKSSKTGALWSIFSGMAASLFFYFHHRYPNSGTFGGINGKLNGHGGLFLPLSKIKLL